MKETLAAAIIIAVSAGNKGMLYKVMQNCGWLILALAFGWAVVGVAGQTPPPLLDVKPNGAEKPAETLKLVKIEFAGLSKRALEECQFLIFSIYV